MRWIQVLWIPLFAYFLNPFDRNWFRRLPTDIQIHALTAIFSHTLSHLDPDADALAYSISPELLEHLPEFDKAEFFSHLIPRLLLGRSNRNSPKASFRNRMHHRF